MSAHRRERVVVDDHQLGRVDGLGARLGDDHGDGVADEAHLVDGQRRPVARGVQREEGARPRQLELARREHVDHAVSLAGVVEVDALDPGVRKRRADESERQGAHDVDVVDEGPLALDERGVLDTADVVAEQRSRHQISLCSRPNTR